MRREQSSAERGRRWGSRRRRRRARVNTAEADPAARLVGIPAPPVTLLATSGELVDVVTVRTGWTIVFVYPRTGVPGVQPPEGWAHIPGALGCTPQSCAYRDANQELLAAGATVFGLSTQDHREQREFAIRERLPFQLLSDPALEFGTPLRLPTFSVEGNQFYRRLTLVVRSGTVEHVRFPIPDPEQDAREILRWVRSRPGP